MSISGISAYQSQNIFALGGVQPFNTARTPAQQSKIAATRGDTASFSQEALAKMEAMRAGNAGAALQSASAPTKEFEEELVWKAKFTEFSMELEVLVNELLNKSGSKFTQVAFDFDILMGGLGAQTGFKLPPKMTIEQFIVLDGGESQLDDDLIPFVKQLMRQFGLIDQGGKLVAGEWGRVNNWNDLQESLEAMIEAYLDAFGETRLKSLLELEDSSPDNPNPERYKWLEGGNIIYRLRAGDDQLHATAVENTNTLTIHR